MGDFRESIVLLNTKKYVLSKKATYIQRISWKTHEWKRGLYLTLKTKALKRGFQSKALLSTNYVSYLFQAKKNITSEVVYIICTIVDNFYDPKGHLLSSLCTSKKILMHGAFFSKHVYKQEGHTRCTANHCAGCTSKGDLHDRFSECKKNDSRAHGLGQSLPSV